MGPYFCDQAWNCSQACLAGSSGTEPRKGMPGMGELCSGGEEMGMEEMTFGAGETFGSGGAFGRW